MKREHSSAWESDRLKTDRFHCPVNVMGSNPIAPTNPFPLDVGDVAFSANDISRGVRIPSFLDDSLAEDIGIQVGDGSVLFYKEPDGDSIYRVECCGHIADDESYLRNFVIPLKRKIFNLEPDLRKNQSAGTCYFRIGSKALVQFYHNVLKLPLGKKVEVNVPNPIFESDKSIVASFLRGLGDTDFSLSFIKKTKRYHKYPVIHLKSASKVLIIQVEELLERFGLKPSKTLDCADFDSRTGNTYVTHNLYISGKRSLNVWMKEIGFHNPSHYTRYLIWKRFGFCPPKTTFLQRMRILAGRLDSEKLES